MTAERNGTEGPYDDSEQFEISARFTQMLWDSTKDGGKKRAAGTKPVWKVDPSHEGAIFSHIAKWKKGEKKDPDSGAHPLVHAAWRCLAIAWQETHGTKSTPQQVREEHCHVLGYGGMALCNPVDPAKHYSCKSAGRCHSKPEGPRVQ